MSAGIGGGTVKPKIGFASVFAVLDHRWFVCLVLLLSAAAIMGCAEIDRQEYLSPSINLREARYSYHQEALGSPSPSAVSFEVGTATVSVTVNPNCERGIMLLVIPPLPVPLPYSPSARESFFTVNVSVMGNQISVNPSKLVLRDPTGHETPGTLNSGLSGVNLAIVGFREECDRADRYELILDGVEVGGQPVSIPGVEITRGSRWDLQPIH
jgi:hypothetical protein